jgi:hypothetical protein
MGWIAASKESELLTAFSVYFLQLEENKVDTQAKRKCSLRSQFYSNQSRMHTIGKNIKGVKTLVMKTLPKLVLLHCGVTVGVQQSAKCSNDTKTIITLMSGSRALS